MGAAPASAPGGAATRRRIVARVHAMPPEHNAGAEHMLVAMLRPLAERGHDVQVWLSRYGGASEPYTYQGIRVMPLQSRLDFGQAARTADVLVSHLECVPSTAALARGYGVPLAVICHNTHRQTWRDVAAGGTALAVYNSLWMEAEAAIGLAAFPEEARPGRELVVRPPVVAADYRRPGKAAGRAVTLVNCNPGKGGHVLDSLARRMPDVQFIAVQGAYGEQIMPVLPNVELVPHTDGADMARDVYGRTKVLIMPSDYESWGRAGVEALASGIPVVAHPTPGLCESLGDAGVFVERTDLDGWESAIRRLLEPAEYRLAAKRARARSAELDPTDDLAAWCDAIESL